MWAWVEKTRGEKRQRHRRGRKSISTAVIVPEKGKREIGGVSGGQGMAKLHIEISDLARKTESEKTWGGGSIV